MGPSPTTPPPVHLTRLHAADADALLAFELHNRAFFEARINARPAAFYSTEGVRAAIAQAERDAAADHGHAWLVRDAAGVLVGRINLSRVRRAHFHSAELGYRMAEAACGQGYASEAVRQVLAQAFGPLGLVRLEATARVGNAGSHRVLFKNGFAPWGRSARSFELGGQWHDLMHYALRVDGSA